MTPASRPRRIDVKLYATPDPGAPVELEPFISLFHGFIQNQSVEGLLIDVADYAHVPKGPGVILIGHDVDYGIDLGGGRAGLLTTRKRYGPLPLAEALRDTLRKALIAAQAIEGEASVDLHLATDTAEIRFVDRLAMPNDEATFAAVKAEIAPVVEKLYGAGYEIAREFADDPRTLLTARVTAAEAVPAATLLQRLGGAAV